MVNCNWRFGWIVCVLLAFCANVAHGQIVIRDSIAGADYEIIISEPLPALIGEYVPPASVTFRYLAQTDSAMMAEEVIYVSGELQVEQLSFLHRPRNRNTTSKKAFREQEITFSIGPNHTCDAAGSGDMKWQIRVVGIRRWRDANDNIQSQSVQSPVREQRIPIRCIRQADVPGLISTPISLQGITARLDIQPPAATPVGRSIPLRGAITVLNQDATVLAAGEAYENFSVGGTLTPATATTPVEPQQVMAHVPTQALVGRTWPRFAVHRRAEV